MCLPGIWPCPGGQACPMSVATVCEGQAVWGRAVARCRHERAHGVSGQLVGSQPLLSALIRPTVG